jgi:hypothetical protein
MSRKDGQSVSLHDIRGLDSETMLDALREMVAGAAHGRTDKPIHHVHIDPPEGFQKPAVFKRYAELYEREFGLEDQQRISVYHMKDGRLHEHKVYCLVRHDGSVVDLSWDRARREKISRIVEVEFGMPLTPGKHNKAVIDALRRDGRNDVADAMVAAGLHEKARPSAVSPKARHQAERTGVDPKAMQAAVLAAWKASDTGTSFETALAASGLRLANGDKGAVVVDQTGNTHSLTRTLGAASKAAGERVNAAAVKARLAEVQLTTLKEVRHAITDAASKPAGGQEAAAGVSIPAAAGSPSGGLASGPSGGTSDREEAAVPVADLHPSESRQGHRAAGAPAPGSVGDRGGGEPARSAGRDQGAPRPDARGHERTAAPDRGAASRRDGPSRAEVSREAARRAQRLAAVARLARMDVSGLRGMAEMLTLAPEQRIRRRLDEIESRANARLEAAEAPIPEPDYLRNAREALVAAKAASVDGYNRHNEADQKKQAIERAEPTGFPVIVNLKRFFWRKELDAAQKVVDDAKTAWDTAAEARNAATADVERLKKQWQRSAERRVAEQAKLDQKGEAVLDKALVREARALLVERPELARGGLADVMERARERLEEQERQRQAAASRRRGADVADRPTAPKF